jgi:hypothetical protein
VKNENEMYSMVAMAAVIGALVGIGKLLQSGDVITLRLAIGRAITTAGLGVAAFSILALFPDLNNTTMLGLAILLASMGESGLEKILNKYTKDK